MALGGESFAIQANLALLAAARDPRQAQALIGSATRRGRVAESYDAVQGHILAAAGDYDGAEDFLRRALRAAPNNATLLLNYAIVLDQLGRGGEAIEFYRRALLDASMRADASRAMVEARLGWLERSAAANERSTRSGETPAQARSAGAGE